MTIPFTPGSDGQEGPPSGGGTPGSRSSLRGKLAILGLSGLLFTGAAVGLTGIASAQDSGGDVTLRPAAEADVTDAEADVIDGGEYEEHDLDEYGDFDDFELSPEDEAVFERLDQCLVENGVDESAFEDDEELTDEQIDALDASLDQALETCEPILEDLGEDFEWLDEDDFDEFGDFGDFGDFEVSPEDEAVFERFDQCMVDNGVDEESFDYDGDVTEEEIEAFEASIEGALTACDPILEDLSEDLQGLWEDCPDDIDHDDVGELETSNA